MSMLEINTDKTMREIADFIKEKCGTKYGFMVLVFPFDEEEASAHYISNANREQMVTVLRNKADILERSMDIKNVGEVQ